jgi:hypothetical protein
MSERDHLVRVGSVIVSWRLYRFPAFGDFVARVGDVSELPCERARRLMANARKHIHRQAQRRVRIAKTSQEARSVGMDQPSDDLRPFKASIRGCLAFGEKQDRAADSILAPDRGAMDGEVERDADSSRPQIKRGQAAMHRTAIELAESELVVVPLEGFYSSTQFQ